MLDYFGRVFGLLDDFTDEKRACAGQATRFKFRL